MGYTISYSLLLISVIITMALADAMVIYKIFFNLDMPEWTMYLRWFFELLPCFHFAKLYGDVARVTSNHLIPEHLLWVPGREFRTEDIFTEVHGVFFTKDRYVVPSMFTTLQRVYCLCAFYLIIAWYLDNVIASNRGHSQPFYFFLNPHYWLKDCLRKLMEKNKPKTRKVSTMIDLHSIGPKLNTA